MAIVPAMAPLQVYRVSPLSDLKHSHESAEFEPTELGRAEFQADRVYPPLAQRVVVVTGATASGKSDVAIQLAQTIGGEILSLDSIAVYRGMDIGTAKPAADQRRKVPHHLIDLVRPDKGFSVAEYLRQAHACVDEIQNRGKVPIFVGGTPMYLKAILRGFDPGPPADADFRAAVQADVRRHGAAAMHQRLRQVDPIAATKIDAADVRRMTRALEVAYLTGVPISHRQIQFDRRHPIDATRVFAIRWQRDQLHHRINRRTEAMFAAGLVDEVQGLIRDGDGLSKTAAQAVGYREVIAALEAGAAPELAPVSSATQRKARRDTQTDSTWKSCKQQVAAHTRQLARRQETWLRSFEEVRWIEAQPGTMGTPECLCECILRQLSA